MDNYSELEDEEINVNAHKKLLNDISHINKIQHITKHTRSEAAKKTSEFSLTKTNTISNNKVHINELIDTLKESGHHTKLSIALKKLKRRKTLKKPLERHVVEKIKRKVGFEKIRKELRRWDAVVTKNKIEDQLIFPLNHEEVEIIKESNKPYDYKIKSSLMKKLESLTPKIKTETTDIDTTKLTLEELINKRKEMARLKIKQSYQIAKAKRISKIKSKKYHKLLKKDKIKAQMNEFEKLKKNYPEEAIKQLEIIEKSRIMERANLRHKNTGTWAKNSLIRAKYNRDVRQEIYDQYMIGKELNQKQNLSDSDEDEQIEEIIGENNEKNPWIEHDNENNELNEFYTGYKNYWTTRNKNKKELSEFRKETSSEIVKNVENESDFDIIEEENEIKDSKNKDLNKDSVMNSSGIWNIENCELKSKKKHEIERSKKLKNTSIDEMFDKAEWRINSIASKKIKNISEDIDNNKNDSYDDEEEADDNDESKVLNNYKKLEMKSNIRPTSIAKNKTTNFDSIDPTNFFIIDSKYTKNKSNISGIEEVLDDDLEDDENTEKNLSLAEAFEEDDIVAEFEEDEVEVNKTLINEKQSLPGWGSWTGSGITKKNISSMKTTPQNKKEKKNDDLYKINIKDKVNPKLKSHLVSDLPFPFTSVKEYEASLRVPIGSTFVPETAHKQLTKPEIITKLGSVIQPMDERILVKKLFKNEVI